MTTLLERHRSAPTAEPAPGAGVLPHRRWVFRLISAGTLFYLAVQLATGLTLRIDTWPVVGFPMFADAPTEHAEPEFTAITAAGQRITVNPGDLGVTRDEAAFWLGRNVVAEHGVLKPGGVAKLGVLAGVYASRHHGQALRQLTLQQQVTDLVHHKPVFTRMVTTWKAP